MILKCLLLLYALLSYYISHDTKVFITPKNVLLSYYISYDTKVFITPLCIVTNYIRHDTKVFITPLCIVIILYQPWY